MVLYILWIELKSKYLKILLNLILLSTVGSFLFVSLSLINIQVHNSKFPLEYWSANLLIETIVPQSSIEEWSTWPEVDSIYYMHSPGPVELVSHKGSIENILSYVVPNLDWVRAFPRTAHLTESMLLSRKGNGILPRAIVTYPLAKRLKLGAGDVITISLTGMQGQPSITENVQLVAIDKYHNNEYIYFESSADVDRWLSLRSNPLNNNSDENWYTRVAIFLSQNASEQKIKSAVLNSIRNGSEFVVTASEYINERYEWADRILVEESYAERRVQLLSMILVGSIFGIVLVSFSMSQLHTVWVLSLLGASRRSLRIAVTMEPVLFALFSGVIGIIMGREIIMNALGIYVNTRMTIYHGVLLLIMLFILALLLGIAMVSYSIIRGKTEWLRRIGSEENV